VENGNWYESRGPRGVEKKIGNFYIAVREWVDSHRCLERELRRITFEDPRYDRVRFSGLFRCIENILQLRGICSSSLDKATQAPLGMPADNFEMSSTTKVVDAPWRNKHLGNTGVNMDSTSGKAGRRWLGDRQKNESLSGLGHGCSCSRRFDTVASRLEMFSGREKWRVAWRFRKGCWIFWLVRFARRP
jgi:hypothetical protein